MDLQGLILAMPDFGLFPHEANKTLYVFSAPPVLDAEMYSHRGSSLGLRPPQGSFSAHSIIYGIFWTPHSSMEGPKVPREARRREAPERRGGWGLGSGAVAPPQYGDLGAMTPENFSKINVEIAYFSAFLQAKMHMRQSDLYKWRALSPARSTGIFFTVPIHFYLVPTLMGGHGWARAS